MTDQTTEPSPTPTTNEELGVVGAQLARAEAADRSNTPAVYPPMLGPEATLAIEALTVAQQAGGTPEEVTDRAATYLQFLKGNS